MNTMGNQNGCAGQMDMMNMLDATKPEEPKMLDIGQVIYTVIRADVRAERVISTYPLEGDRGYHTDKGAVWNSSIGLTAFTSKTDADALAADYLRDHHVIMPEDIQPVEIRAWFYIRECDGRKMTAFYAIKEDGKAYIKEFMTFHHIKDFENMEKAQETLEKNFHTPEFEYYNPEPLKDYVPELKQMYKCRKEVDWDWAEAEYSGIE